MVNTMSDKQPAHPLTMIEASKRKQLTTRGTPRQRTPKGFWANTRYEILAGLPPELVEEALQRKLRRFPLSKRERVVAVREGLNGEERREVVLVLLS